MGTTYMLDFLFFTSNISFYLKYRKWIGEESYRKYRARGREGGDGRFSDVDGISSGKRRQ